MALLSGQRLVRVLALETVMEFYAFAAIEQGEGDAIDFKMELRRNIHLALWHAMIACDDADDAALSTWTRKVIQTGYAMPVGLLVFAMGVSMTNQ